MRIARSPLVEAVLGLRVLADPVGSQLHRGWAASARSRLDGVDVETLVSLWAAGPAVPEFLMPPPLSATPEPAGELARVRATPAAQIRRDLSLTYRSSLPPGLEPLYNRPAAGIDALVRLLHAYWERALADHWPRMRAMLDADVGYRTSALGVGGSRAALGGLHELVGLDGNDLLVGAQGDEPEQCVDVGGEGLLLLPSIFAWPSVATMLRSPWPPALIYPSRGMGRLWHVGGPSSGPASLQPWRRSCSWGSISSSAASWRGCSPGTSS